MPKTNNSHYFTSSAMDGEITIIITPDFQKLEKSENQVKKRKISNYKAIIAKWAYLNAFNRCL